LGSIPRFTKAVIISLNWDSLLKVLIGYVVDPLEDIEPYLQVAKDDGIQITHIFNTHIQADHISEDRKLADKTGAKIYMHESAKVNYNFEPLKDGDILAIGNPKVKVIHTPGDTPESMSLLFAEYPKTTESIVLTGDTLFRGNVSLLMTLLQYYQVILASLNVM
jgi:hydroxyacylglutathione hydrolase